MDPEPLQDLLDRAVFDGVFPGAQLAVRAAGATLDLCAGFTALNPFHPAPITPQTRFDIASLTKALATSVLLMQAVDELGFDLDTPIERWFPRLAQADAITPRLLAAHRAGLADHRPFFRTLSAEQLDPGSARFRMKELIAAEPLVAAPNTETRYSDLGYMLLGWILEAAFDRGLDALFRDQIAARLGLTRTSFGPVPRPVAATEIEGDQPLLGVVHDENARATGGVEGHAGLFSTAADVAALTEHLRAVHGGLSRGIVRPTTVRHFWQAPAGSSFALGWDTPTEPSSSGRFTTRGGAVGHLGFTGCSVWCDWVRGVTVVLLTNRVHPTRANEAIKAFRPLLHDAVAEWLRLRPLSSGTM